MTYEEETIMIANDSAFDMLEAYRREVKHLLNSGAIDRENHNRGLVYGVALENIADGYLSGWRGSRHYKNMKRF
jgi:hypothetical protein